MTLRRNEVMSYVVAVAAACVIGPRGPVYWDSFGYVAQAVTGRVGGLAFGRPLFVIASHALVRLALAAGMSVWNVEPLLRHAWVLVAALAAPLTYALARGVGLDARAARWAGFAVALSPAMAHTSRAVLTDAPAVAASLGAIVCAVRAFDATARRPYAWACATGVLLAVAFGLREQSIVAALSVVLLAPLAPRGRRLAPLVVAMCIAGAGVAALLAWAVLTQPGYVASVRGWMRAMNVERDAHSIGTHDVAMYLLWLLALGPATLVAAVCSARDRPRRWTPFAAVVLPSLVQLVALVDYPDIAYSPRYLLAAFPCALALPAGIALARWTDSARAKSVGIFIALALPLLVAAPFVRRSEAPLARVLSTLPADLDALPRESTIVSGQVCPAVAMTRTLAAREGNRADWRTICPGWSWPRDAAAAFGAVRASGRTLVIDARDASWLGAGQRRCEAEALAYARSNPGPRLIVWR